MKRRTISRILAATTAASAALVMTGCIQGGNGTDFDCISQSDAFEETAAGQGLLQEEVPNEGPFPMAMVLSTDAVNTLLAKVLDQDLPPITQDLDLLSITFQPQLPTLEIAAVQDCPGCVISDIGFDIQVDTGVLGVVNGAGSVKMSLPVGLAPITNTRTGLIASMDEVSVLNLDVEIAGLSTNQSRDIERVLRDIATNYVRSEIGAVEVAQFDSWQIGDDDTLLSARGPMIFPEQKTIVIGLNTNLILPGATTVEEQATLPEGSQIGLQIHPNLLLTTMQRMLGIGLIPQNYNASGQVEERGDHQVTLEAMRSTDSSKLNTSMRIWRTGGGLCGFADVSSDLSLRINADAIELEAENFEVTDGEGIGELLADAASSWIASDFMESFTDQMALTINYKEFGVEEDKGSVSTQPNEVVIDGRGLSVFLNLGID